MTLTKGLSGRKRVEFVFGWLPEDLLESFSRLQCMPS